MALPGGATTRAIVASAAVALVVAAGTLLRSSSRPAPPLPLARIGRYEVTAAQLALRQRHSEVFFPGSSSPDVALAQLIQGFVAAELMARAGTPLDLPTWEAEATRIDSQTHDRATLERMKAVYGANRSDYLYVGILPDYARSRLFRMFQSSHQRSDSARRKASSFLDAVESHPRDFAAQAALHGAALTTWSVNKSGMRRVGAGLQKQARDEAPGVGETPDAARATGPQAGPGAEEVLDRSAAEGLLSKLADLPEGALYPRTLETPDSILAVRLLRRKAAEAEVEMAAFPKDDFGSYFERESKAVPIEVSDQNLVRALLNKVAWARNLAWSGVRPE